MVHDSLRNVRLDRRLEHRPGWLPAEERQRELATLPDVSDKIAPPEPAEEETERAEAGAEDRSEPTEP